MRPSSRKTEMFCSSMKTADTTLTATSASAACTIRSFSAAGTYSPSTLPVMTGTSAPSTTATSPPSATPRSSPPVPRTLKRSSPSRPNGTSGSGR